VQLYWIRSSTCSADGFGLLRALMRFFFFVSSVCCSRRFAGAITSSIAHVSHSVSSTVLWWHRFVLVRFVLLPPRRQRICGFLFVLRASHLIRITVLSPVLVLLPARPLNGGPNVLSRNCSSNTRANADSLTCWLSSLFSSKAK
jgi:hypothetical protein